MNAQPSVIPTLPVERPAAFPGALLAVTGLFLIVWALRDWGVLDSTPATAEAVPA